MAARPGRDHFPERERELARVLATHEAWRERSVFNLMPSENVVSRRARSYLASGLAGRYTLPLETLWHGEHIQNVYGGTAAADAVERIGAASALRLFGGGAATVRPPSGHLAAMEILMSTVRRGDRALVVPQEEGGYDGYAPPYLPHLLGFRSLSLPVRGKAHVLRAREAVTSIQHYHPKVVLLGQSFVLFPYPLAPIVQAAHALGAKVLYDGSHVMGLIAGGAFQDPIAEGVDILFGSTHKSLPGPQGGLIVTREREALTIMEREATWRAYDNAHWNRIAGVAQTLLELERWGSSYARSAVRNATALGAALDRRGLPVVMWRGEFTRSHQLLIDVARLRGEHGLGPSMLSLRLERNGLLTDRVGRFGTAEITRLGLRVDDMDGLAELIVRAGIRGDDVRDEVRAWRRTFRGLRFE